MAHFKFIFDELSYRRALEQNSAILIPFRKLIWCTYIVIEAQVQTVKNLLGFSPPYKSSGFFFFLAFQLCFADDFTLRQTGAPSTIIFIAKKYTALTLHSIISNSVTWVQKIIRFYTTALS